MALDTDLEAWLILSLAPGLTHDAFRQLLVAFGGPQDILGASRADLAAATSDRAARAVLSPVPTELLNKVSEWLEDEYNHVITLGDAAYPHALLDVADPPPLLYAQGRLELLNRPAFSIVGSRNATQQGIAHAEAFGRALSDAGLTIVSGLALGIDAAAHWGGLAGASSTIAVVGTGLDTVYPPRNRDLARELARRGCLVSEFQLGTAPVASNFPRRNRIISGLGHGCLVVEAALSSGSLITARLANEQGKDVFAMPGSIHSPLTKGCHALIKDGAKLAETAADILEELKLPEMARQHPASADADVETDANDEPLAQLGYDPCDFDTVAARTGLAPDTLAALLTQWEIAGLIEALPGGRYQRVR
jgi:DNA processing protein